MKTVSDRIEYLLPVVLLAVAAILVFLGAPRHGEFWWSEAPRNALNGAFVLDLVRDRPLDHARDWAFRYYYQYPALTVLFYPPLLYGALAAVYAVAGVGHAAAVGCVVFFLFLLALAVYSIARRLSTSTIGLAAAFFVLAAPEVIIWGQQVMLEIPMLAFCAWAAFFVLRYADSGRARELAIAAALIVASAYTKQTGLVVGGALGLSLLFWIGLPLLKRSHTWIICAVAIIGLIPLALMQYKFGSFNVATVAGRADVTIPRASFEGMTWYARRLPGMFGLVATLLAGYWVVAWAARRTTGIFSDRRFVVVAWFVVCYAVLTMIHLKETRHGLLLAVPLALAAALSADRLPRPRLSQPIVLALAVGCFAWTLAHPQTPYVTGYSEAANWIADNASRDSRVMFAGMRDGSFIFNLRVRDDRRDLSVVRADKMFLNINIMPDLGLNPKEFSETEVSAMLYRYGIGYVVTVPNVWSETKVMADFHEVLGSAQFEEMIRIPVTGTAPERELVIYRNRGTLKSPPDDFGIDLPSVGVKVTR